MKRLPIKQGLNPTRAQVPRSWPGPVAAAEFVWFLIDNQRHRAPTDSFSAVLSRFSRGEVLSDAGTRLRPFDAVHPGSFVNFYRAPAPEREVPGDIHVLHQDDTLVVIDKPPFLSTMPRGQHISQTALVKARVQLGIPELSPSHRLDRLTRGVLMFTARREARGAYQTMFERREATKIYEALTPRRGSAPFAPIERFADWHQWPAPSEDQPWTLTHHMVKIRGHLSTYVVEPPAGAAAAVPPEANAVTHVLGVREDVRDGRDVLVWRLKPATGKTHQLRVVLRSLGLPIINDPLYEELSDAALHDPSAPTPHPPFADEEDFSRPMGLIAKELRFTDPLTGELRRFSSNY